MSIVSPPLISLVQLARDKSFCKALGKTPGEVNESGFRQTFYDNQYIDSSLNTERYPSAAFTDTIVFF
jgi:hypothetical protein